MRRPAPFLLLAVSLAAAAAAFSCARRETLVEQGNRDHVLYRALDGDPADLDPHVVTGLAEAKVLAALFDPLVRLDRRTLRPVPALAESWDLSPDALTYTFHLRAARWSDGQPITAQDCIDTWRRILTPSLAADYASQFTCIRGAAAYLRTGGDFSGVGLAAPDARTLVVTLERPVPYFLGLLDQSAWVPLPVRVIAAHGDPDRRGNSWTRPGSLVSSGPFILQEWVAGQHVRVVKSPTYWNAAQVHLAGITFVPMDSAEAQERAFRAGQVHVTDRLPLSKVAAYRSESSPFLRTDPSLDTYFLRFNVRRAPLDDIRIRRALSLAVNREALARQVLRAGQQPAATLVPPGLPDYTPPTRPVSDLAAARRLLAEAGHADGHGLPALELLVPANGVGPVVGEAVQEIWRRDLGLEVRLQRQEQKVIYAERRAGNYQILLGDWVGDYFDATTYLDLWLAGSGNNHTGWQNPAYDALLAEAARTTEPAARGALLQRAEALLLDDAPIAPLYFNTHVYLVHPAVKGWNPSPLDKLDYQDVRLEP